jgi:membrane associated rhomboid family serine protease
MLIPIGHENMESRRWPIVTFALIFINLAVFVFTRDALESGSLELEKLKVQILLLTASHPELDWPDEIETAVAGFREKHPEEWVKISAKDRHPINEWDAHMQLVQNRDKLQEEMDALAAAYIEACDSSILQKYGFIPANPNLISYLTANFLHGGWMHLIGNMWFLWLAGFVLEDVWGRSVYLIVYIVAGAAALQFHAWTNAGSLVSTIGASGAVAALMGAFLVRFPKLKIKMLWIYFFFRTRQFEASAYWLLSLWLLIEVFYGLIFGELGGIAHWAHVGGFIFGALIALFVRFSGIEHKVNTAIDKQLHGDADPEIRRAYDLLDNRQMDAAIVLLQNHVAANPASVDAWNLLRDIYWQKRDYPSYQQSTLKSCALHLKAREDEAAWRDYEDYINSGGKEMPISIRFDLCRLLENRGELERAIEEYGKIAIDNPSDRQAFLAQLAAGRICLKKLNRPEDALKFYEAAESSPAPHLDYDQAIQTAIQETKAVLLTLHGNTEYAECAEQRGK